MANNNLVARLDNENIVIVDEINDHAVGENSGIFDETTDTLYPFGGGSGSAVHKLKVKFVNNDDSPIAIDTTMGYVVDDNNILMFNSNFAVGTSIIDFMYFHPGANVPMVLGFASAEYTTESSDLVNCSVSSSAVIITDPNIDASITLTHNPIT